MGAKTAWEPVIFMNYINTRTAPAYNSRGLMIAFRSSTSDSADGTSMELKTSNAMFQAARKLIDNAQWSTADECSGIRAS